MLTVEWPHFVRLLSDSNCVLRPNLSAFESIEECRDECI
jgi:hypothetical protein